MNSRDFQAALAADNFDMSFLGLEQHARARHPRSAEVVDVFDDLARRELSELAGGTVSDEGVAVLRGTAMARLESTWTLMQKHRPEFTTLAPAPELRLCRFGMDVLERVRAKAKAYEVEAHGNVVFIDPRANAVVMGFQVVTIDLRRSLFQRFGAVVVAWEMGPITHPIG